jgi:sucrose-6-phosphate hydrolase SacC (GH32 family)
MHFYRILLLTAFFMVQSNLHSQVKLDANPTNETLYRPNFHFTPQKGWMNDPNGMIFLNGQYHLFYQHYPDATVWGPMHWGQATSKDLVQWEHQPIALYPDSIGMIFSGSAVLDQNNTSGLGRNGVAPLVAIFTQHFMPGEKAGRTDFQNQSIAYSLDEGKTWTKYAGNPVLKTPNLKDFRESY